MNLASGDARVPRREGQSIPFRVAIITMVVGLLVVTCGFLLAFGLYTSHKSMAVLKDEYLDQLANTTAREVFRLPDTAEQILKVQRYRIENGLYPTADPVALAQVLAGALETDPDVQWVSYSEDATGRFMGARRLQGSEFILNVSDPKQNQGVPREMRADTLAPFVTPTSQTKPYDPRLLAWYRRAMEQLGTVVWMPPYVFAEGVTGVTVASTASDRSGRVLGVVTVDFALSGIANFLGGLKIGENGVVVLF